MRPIMGEYFKGKKNIKLGKFPEKYIHWAEKIIPRPPEKIGSLGDVWSLIAFEYRWAKESEVT